MTTCSPLRWTSRSVRPSVGRISAVRPATTWDRLSLVETCTVIAQLRRAASVTSVSGVARTKLPPMPMKNDARPSRIASIAATVSKPWSRGRGEGELLVERVVERRRHPLEDPHGPVALDVGVPAHGADAGAGAADVALQEQEVDDLAQRLDRVLVLREPHGPAHDRAAGAGEAGGEALDLLPGQSGRGHDLGPVERPAGTSGSPRSRSCARRGTPGPARTRDARPPCRAGAGRRPGTAPCRRRSGPGGSRRSARCR